MTHVTLYSTQLVEDRRIELPVAVALHRDDLGEIASYLIGRKDREHMLALFLNSQAQVTGCSIVAIGHASGITTSPKEVLRACLLAGAPCVALAHNHPSGELTPSPQDVEFTARISEGAKLLGIVLFDHVIVHFDRYRSMDKECPSCFIGTV